MMLAYIQQIKEENFRNHQDDNFLISVNDPDGDEVRCRWSESSKRECADVCHAFPGAVLDEV